MREIEEIFISYTILYCIVYKIEIYFRYIIQSYTLIIMYFHILCIKNQNLHLILIFIVYKIAK